MPHNPWLSMGFVFALILYGSGVLILLWALLSTQMLILHLPMVVLANTDTCSGKQSTELSGLDAFNSKPAHEPLGLREFGAQVGEIGKRPPWMGFFPLWKHSLDLAFGRLDRTLLYGAIWLFFLYVWLMVFDLPVLSWYAFEAVKASLRGETFQASTMPRLILGIFQIWGTLVHACILPLYVSAATIFWYDGNISRSGLDLKIWLARLRGQANAKAGGPV